MDADSNWVPKVGQVIYTANDQTDEDAWDDSELIAHWDAAMAEYRRMHGKGDDPPFSSHEPERTSKEKPTAKKSKMSPVRDDTASVYPIAPDTQPPAPPPMSVPGYHHPINFSQYTPNDSYTQMIMAWYYAGYYTGYYQGRRNRSNSIDPQARQSRASS